MRRSLVAFVVAMFAAIVSAEDKIGKNLSADLDGTVFTYQYELGHHYELWFENGYVRYRRTNKTGDEEWRDRVPYYARNLHDGEYMVGWKQPERGNYVSLVINMGKMRIFSSAILKGYERIHFQEAKIIGIRKE